MSLGLIILCLLVGWIRKGILALVRAACSLWAKILLHDYPTSSDSISAVVNVYHTAQ